MHRTQEPAWDIADASLRVNRIVISFFRRKGHSKRIWLKRTWFENEEPTLRWNRFQMQQNWIIWAITSFHYKIRRDQSDETDYGELWKSSKSIQTPVIRNRWEVDITDHRHTKKYGKWSNARWYKPKSIKWNPWYLHTRNGQSLLIGSRRDIAQEYSNERYVLKTNWYFK